VVLIRIALVGQASMQIYQAADSVRSADLIVVFFAQPWKLLFEQHQHLLNKRLRGAILDCHAVLLKGFSDWKMGRLKRN
jgi:hypothetical protein